MIVFVFRNSSREQNDRFHFSFEWNDRFECSNNNSKRGSKTSSLVNMVNFCDDTETLFRGFLRSTLFQISRSWLIKTTLIRTLKNANSINLQIRTNSILRTNEASRTCLKPIFIFRSASHSGIISLQHKIMNVIVFFFQHFVFLRWKTQDGSQQPHFFHLECQSTKTFFRQNDRFSKLLHFSPSKMITH